MHFGFSYVGLIYLIMLFVPNIKWAKNKPADYDLYVKNESKVLLALERAGEVLVTVIVLIFSDFNLHGLKWWDLWLAVSFFLMILYEMYWHRYFKIKGERKMSDQYRSFAGFPLAGATLPVLAFLLLGIYGTNILLIISVVILGIGHIGIHLAHEKEVRGSDEKKSLLKTVLEWKWIILAIAALVFVAVSFVAGKIGGLKVIEFSNDAVRYEYPSDNILGIKGAVIDGSSITYIFDKGLCVFNGYDVERAGYTGGIYACRRNVRNVRPEAAFFNRKNGDIYLTLSFGEDTDMSRVDGFYLYLSDDEWITVSDSTENTYISHIEVNSHEIHNPGTEAQYESAHGRQWDQCWNLDGSGKWSEVREKSYGWDNMPLE